MMTRVKHMDITFDISKDELPIFLAEVDEHLQMLDNNMLLLQREDAGAELIQTVFRSAHTIKGMAGMVGHRRMTDVTHALETVLDGVRKNSIQISAGLVDLCLQAVDCLRLLRNEVENSIESDVDIEGIVFELKELVEGKNAACSTVISSPTSIIENNKVPGNALQINAKIDTNSMASGARAFQLMMSLQDLGEIQAMCPSQEEIEAASSIGDFSATFVTDQSFEKIREVLTRVSGVDEISINGNVILADGNPVS